MAKGKGTCHFIHLVIELAIAAVSGFVGGNMYIHFTERIENLSRENGQLIRRIDEKENAIVRLNTKCDTLQEEWKKKYSLIETELKNKETAFDKLQKKYDLLIYPGGIIATITKTDNDERTYRLQTNDQIKIDLVSVSVFLKQIRVTEKGPVIKISGCKRYHTQNGFRSPIHGDNAYRLTEDGLPSPEDTPFIITFSQRSCKRDELVSASRTKIVIQLRLIDYNVDDQTSTIEFRKQLYDNE